MIAKQILQKTLDGNKSITGADMCLTDLKGDILVSTYEEDGASLRPLVVSFIASEAEVQEIQEKKFFKVMDGQNLEYVLVVCTEGESGYMCGKMIVFQLQGLLVAFRERFDKDNFIKNLILDNLLLVDIYNRAQKLNIEVSRPRVVFLIEAPKGKYYHVLEKVRGLFTASNTDFITSVDERNIILIKELEKTEGFTELNKTATVIRGLFPKKEIESMRISFGSVVQELREVSSSYKEARMALEVGRIFYEKREIIPYGTLGIGRLIYQLPVSLCELFTKEIFGDTKPEDLDEEMLMTIHKFFECSLNVSETARQLFIHRNTLVYRLDKLHKMTGLDIRVFEDAITFKIGLMVLNYMKVMSTTEFNL